MVKVITPPKSEPVNLDEFKVWMQGLPISTEQEPIVESLLKAGREEAEAYQNAAYCEQTLQFTTKLFQQIGQLIVTIPRPPLRALQSVTAILPDGTQQDVTTQFDLYNNGGLATLTLKPDGDIPACDWLQITYTAGYDTVPAKVKQAILLYATWAWTHRGGDTAVPPAFYALLSKGRVVPV